MSQFEVDTDEVNRAATAAGRSAAALNTEVANMFRILTELQRAWRGSASNAFTDLANRWRNTQRQVEADLEQISEALSTTAVQYGEAESANTSMFRR